ncbi:FAD-dependent monooxygenase [Okeania sp. SIO2B3]|uniref:FAD-dependent monooxygenase n=1 Tax=Okeania sp. SIO2B3 TaxID=2607784 RepID=UPI0013C1E0FE|nr:FAD-dependent monooxygenase [Okeania sp. SIO2B3]NET41010.1 hypothetical protein [Okeania sp. SIO2B3]
MKAENSSPKIDYDVAIVGAGPVGLATALGLRQRGIENIIVLDQTRAFRKVGQGVDLLPNGLKAVKYIDNQAYENIKETGQTFSNPPEPNPESESKKNQSSPEWTTRNVNGQKIRSFVLKYDEWFDKYGEGRVSISWYDLQTQLRMLLPSDRLKTNHRCVNVVPEPELKCVRADFIYNQGVEANRTNKTVENRDSFYLDIGLTNTGCTAQLTIPSAVNAPGNFFLII